MTCGVLAEIVHGRTGGSLRVMESARACNGVPGKRAGLSTKCEHDRMKIDCTPEQPQVRNGANRLCAHSGAGNGSVASVRVGLIGMERVQ